MKYIDRYRDEIANFIENIQYKKNPDHLYEPIEYILNLGGKRIRSVLTLFSAEIFNTPSTKALYAAVAIEMFHNFSLIHDDIMDDAPLRRGNQTVHEKWNLNTGILSGDAMLILAYQYFENYPPAIFRELAQLFSKTALEVCEGQQWDIDFETRKDVSIEEYIQMIDYKTAVLVGAAFQMGAIVAETTKENKQKIYDFGRYLGIAFQLQDDYLDAFGDPLTFGKQIGGDILENKKTYLYLKALENANDNQKAELIKWFSTTELSKEKVDAVKQLFVETGVIADSENLIKEYTDKALDLLNQLDIAEDYKEELREFSLNLMNRTV
ncbi:polyprenyl synthetase family protein [Capnocytophaga sp. ARDL2]|uniref:polyprenyl synthetase family protein n=1 Tax=Capnocytophaga sp. ARDL2 TaxID=3238809 RepID=UPI003555D789